MTDLYVTHLLFQHLDDLRRTGEARALVQRALRERREASALERGGRAGRAAAGRAAAGPTPAPCCAVGA